MEPNSPLTKSNTEEMRARTRETINDVMDSHYRPDDGAAFAIQLILEYIVLNALYWACSEPLVNNSKVFVLVVPETVTHDADERVTDNEKQVEEKEK